MSGRFFHALWQSIAAPLLMVGSRLLRSTMRDQRRRAPASALSQRHDSSRDDASGRLRESAPRQSRLTGRSRTTLWDAEPEGWVGEQEDGPTCLTSCLGKIPRFHIRVKQESQNVGLEIASAVEVSAERRLTGRVRAEMTVSVVAPGTADAADARGRRSRESQRIPNSKRPTRGPIRDADAAAAFLRVAANGGCRGEPERDGAFVRTTETINRASRCSWCSGYRRRHTGPHVAARALVIRSERQSNRRVGIASGSGVIADGRAAAKAH